MPLSVFCGVGVKRYSKKRRRAMSCGEIINRVEVFEAFDWICSICQEQIDRTLRFPNKRAATLDHIVPLSKGGRHVRDNVAPAHADCNEDKADALPLDTAQTLV